MPANLESVEEAIKALRGASHKVVVSQTKIILASGAHAAGDVVAQGATGSTPWEFNFKGVGYITKAVVVAAATAITPRLVAFLYGIYPTCELDDADASLQPVAGDVPYFVGTIAFPALTSVGSGSSYSVATPNTYGNVPVTFSVPKLYLVLVTLDIVDFTDSSLMTIILSADVEDN